MLEFKSKLIVAVMAIFWITVVTSCDKSDTTDLGKEVIKTQKDNLLKANNGYEECAMGLINLNVRFWTELSMNSLEDVEYVCENEDVEGLINLAGFTEEELLVFMDSSIYYAQCIPQIDSVACNCTSEINFDNIYNFVVKIQDNGGPSNFFAVYTQEGDPVRLRTVAECMAECTLMCVVLAYYPPAWAACILACTGACYYLSTTD